mmetsp:Transcript_41349/g.102799  ORF Transcript_41349/g.102799 Transcript_41349/m.102799 type:complete len:97 (+) Transcript_41349:190-480(+)
MSGPCATPLTKAAICQAGLAAMDAMLSLPFIADRVCGSSSAPEINATRCAVIAVCQLFLGEAQMRSRCLRNTKILSSGLATAPFDRRRSLTLRAFT